MAQPPPPTRLLVLSIVRIMQPVHGYDLRRELLSWRAEDWANVAPGSIYGALKTLRRDGLIEVVDTQRQGTHPDRTRYQVTVDGEKEYHAMLRDAWWNTRAAPHPLLPAVTQLPFSDRGDLAAALKARVHRLESDITLCHRDIERIEAGSGDPVSDTPYHVAEMQRLSVGLLEAELAWTIRLLGRIESGDLDVWSATSPEGRAHEDMLQRQADASLGDAPDDHAHAEKSLTDAPDDHAHEADADPPLS